MPGFFGEQAFRLRRVSWSSADELADELYALAGITGPAATGRPLVLTQTDPNTPAITINNKSGNAGATTIQIIRQNPDGTRTMIPVATGDGPVGGSGGGSGGTPQQQQNNGREGMAFMGTVLSGFGVDYVVSIFTSTGSEEVSVRQMVIAGGDAVPAGSAVIVVFNGGAYRMQAPVWSAAT